MGRVEEREGNIGTCLREGTERCQRLLQSSAVVLLWEFPFGAASFPVLALAGGEQVE